MRRIVHFEIHASDPQRAMRFYESVFGWKFQKWEWGTMDYWMVETGPKEEAWINGGLLRRDKAVETGSPTGFVCTMDVPSIDEYVDKAVANGARIAVPKTEITGAGWLAYCKDPEGNLFGMMESANP